MHGIVYITRVAPTLWTAGMLIGWAIRRLHSQLLPSSPALCPPANAD